MTDTPGRLSTVWSVLVVLVALATAACTANTGAGEPTTVEVAPETSIVGDPTPQEETTVDADEEADVTEEPAETTTSTSPPTTTEPNQPDPASIEAEVERVIQRNWEIWVACTADIEACDPASALAETESTSSSFYLASVDIVEQWRQQGIVYRLVDGAPDNFFVRIDSIEVAPDLMSAVVLLCDRDNRAQLERNAAGEYVVVPGSDYVEDLLMRRVVAIEDGEWKIVDNELLDRRSVIDGAEPLC